MPTTPRARAQYTYLRVAPRSAHATVGIAALARIDERPRAQPGASLVRGYCDGERLDPCARWCTRPELVDGSLSDVDVES